MRSSAATSLRWPISLAALLRQRRARTPRSPMRCGRRFPDPPRHALVARSIREYREYERYVDRGRQRRARTRSSIVISNGSSASCAGAASRRRCTLCAATAASPPQARSLPRPHRSSRADRRAARSRPRRSVGASASDRLLSFDMGGTTAKSGAIVDGVPQVVSEFEAAGKTHSGRSVKGSGYPVRFPFVDLAEVSAGGGTIAWIDDAGSLRVGPLSAGADPGPACYGRSDRATVTDANVVLGRLNGEHLLGGAFPIDALRSREAVARLGTRSDAGVEATAAGIVALADDAMAKVLRIVTVERGLDPRDSRSSPSAAAARCTRARSRRTWYLAHRHPRAAGPLLRAAACPSLRCAPTTCTPCSAMPATQMPQRCAAVFEHATRGPRGARSHRARPHRRVASGNTTRAIAARVSNSRSRTAPSGPTTSRKTSTRRTVPAMATTFPAKRSNS